MQVVDVKRGLFRGPRPPSLDYLQAHGIKRVISLQSGIYDLLVDDEYEQQFPCEYGMEAYHLECSDFAPPTPRVVRKFLDLAVNHPKPTFVHCLSGVDRTGFLCAVYRMQIENWTYGDAKAEWIKLGRHPWYFVWNSELKKWAKK